MRKLISLLAAVTLTASASASVIACGQIQPKAKEPAVYNSQDINILLKQVAKAYYLNSNKSTNYDFNYVYENMIKNKWIKQLDATAETSNTNGINNNSRFTDIQSTYFGNELISSKLKDKSNIQIISGAAPKDPNIIMNISNIYPTLISFMSNGQIIEMILFLVDLGITLMPQIISDQGLLEYAAALLPDANIKKLADALSPSTAKYQNYTMEEVLNSSIVDFGNALNVFAGKEARYKNSTAKEANEWRAAALNGSVLAMQDLSKQSNVNLNIVDNWDSLCSIVNFARVLVIYLNNFATQRLEIIEKSESNIETLSWSNLQSIRNTKYSQVKNELDIKNLIRYLDKTFNDESGKEIQNLLQFLFRGHDKYKPAANGLIPDIDGFMYNFTNTVYDDAGLSGVFKALLNGTSTPNKPIGSMLVGGLGLVSSNNNIVGKISESILRPLITTALKAAAALGTIDEKTANLLIDLINDGILSKPWDVTWNKFLIPFTNKKLNENGKVNILGFPISGDYTIKTLLTRLTDLTTTDDQPVKIDFNNVSNLINQLQGVVKVAQENPKDLLTKLGYIRPSIGDDKEFIKSGSFFDYLGKILNDTKGNNGLFTALNNKTKEFKEAQEKLKQEMQEKFDSIEVSSEKQIDDNNFEYVINDETTVATITITIKVVKNKYSISAMSIKN